jgi:uncharacterized glyoxalase superfamily protein PhnB
MPAIPAAARSTVTPCLQYRDAPAAIEWLCRTFGFEKHLVVPGENGTILHAQLSFGNGMIMLGSSGKDSGYIVMDIEDAGYGGRGFTCRDHEGHVWSIGIYDPWQQ